MTPRYFNPLDRENLGKSVAQAVLEETAFSIYQIDKFDGAGIYVIYYKGDFPDYKPISDRNHTDLTTPIYIGKAVPSGGRKGLVVPLKAVGPKLYKRLIEHCNSLEQAENLEAKDFWVKCLIVDDIWIPLGETMLIQYFRPLWNSALEGFGNHNPGKGRHLGARPNWDVLHPGRPWVKNFAPGRLSLDQIRENIREFYSEPTKFEVRGDPDEGETQ